VFVLVLVTVDTGELVGAVDFVLVTVRALAAHLGLGVETDEGKARVLVVGEGRVRVPPSTWQPEQGLSTNCPLCTRGARDS